MAFVSFGSSFSCVHHELTIRNPIGVWTPGSMHRGGAKGQNLGSF